MANASRKHGMGAGLVQGHQTAGSAGSQILDEDDLAGRVKGVSRHADNDPRQHNERTTPPGSQGLPDQPDE